MSLSCLVVIGVSVIDRDSCNRVWVGENLLRRVGMGLNFEV